MKIKTPITTDAEAWKFLIDMGGEFRIHTNRNGLKVYINLYSREYTGYGLHYERRHDLSVPSDPNTCAGRPTYIHRQATTEYPTGYAESISGKTLVEIVNKHIENMSGEVLTYVADFDKMIIDDSLYAGWTLEFKGSLEEFKKLSLI